MNDNMDDSMNNSRSHAVFGTVTQIAALTWQILLLWIISKVGDLAQQLTHIPIPGNVLAMLLLFLLLLKGWIKLNWVSAGSDFLLKYLTLFFIPIAVGIMDYGELFWHDGVKIFLIILASTSIGLVTAGWTAQRLSRSRNERG